MIVTVLGCGTSTGVPILTCPCEVCRSDHPRNKRLRASVWIQTGPDLGEKSLLIDTSTDLRQQALRADIRRVDAILFTHPHADHIGGLDEVRAFNFVQGAPIPAYGNAWTAAELRTRFSYVFSDAPVEGGGIPQLDLTEIPAGTERFEAAGVPVTPIPLQHGSQECLGFRINDFAYLTDFNEIPESSLKRLEGVKTLVLDCVRISPHDTHLHLDGALEFVREVRPQRTYLTHLGHDFDYETWSEKLPEGVELAYDGLEIRA